MEVFGIVYLIWCKINGARYVGQTTKTVEQRFYQHACNKKSLIGKAIQKYGKENFLYGVIKSCASKEEMNYWEKFYIVVLKSKAPYGYNRKDGGEGFAGLERTPEYCAKLAEGRLGEKNPFFGKHHTNEHCKKLSVLYRGYSPYKNLIAELDDYKLTYAVFAKLLGLMGVSAKMRGKENFTERDKVNLVEIFGKPIEYLLEREDGKNFWNSRHGYSPFKNLVTELDKQYLSYTAFAQIMGLSIMNFSNKMRGKIKFTDADKAQIVKFFGLSAEYLFQREDRTETKKKERRKSQFKNLLSELDAHNLTYAALARLIDLSESSIYGKMSGIYNFTERDKAKLVEIFGKPLEYLLERTEG